jgi:hypothetical protein
LSMKHTLADKKLEYEALMRAQKEKEKDSRNMKKLEIQLRAGQDALNNLRLHYETILAQVILHKY